LVGLFWRAGKERADKGAGQQQSSGGALLGMERTPTNAYWLAALAHNKVTCALSVRLLFVARFGAKIWLLSPEATKPATSTCSRLVEL